MFEFTHGMVVSLDGQTVRASFERATELSPVHLVSAWCSQNGGLVMGQLKTESKSNDITAIPELLKLLAIKGCMVTIDAMGCQTQIAKPMMDQEGDHLLALKRHQKKTYQALTTHFHDQIEHHLNGRDEHNCFDAFDDSHGLTVRRRVWSVSDLSPIAAFDKWEGVNSIVAVETIRQANRQAEVTRDDRFYLSSLVRSAKEFAS